MTTPRVLMVTGAYFPEVSGGGLQTRALINALRGAAECLVLTTTAGANESTEVDGVPVFRVHVDPLSQSSFARALVRMIWLVARLRRSFDVLHLQGFSRKNILLTAAARLFGRPVLLTLHTSGHDDLAAIRRTSRLAFWSVTQAAGIVAVSPGLIDAASRVGIAATKLDVIPNGIDVARFQPISSADRQEMRRRLGIPESSSVILSVGFFSEEKGQQRVFQAWAGLPPEVRGRSTLVFVGQSSLPHPEVDPRIASDIKQQSGAIGATPIFVERALEIEKYYQVADVFVLASTREGCPVALLEAMACGLPVIATRLPGSTDAIVAHRVNGLLVEPGNVEELRHRLLEVLRNPVDVQPLGIKARETICAAFTLERARSAYEAIYRALAFPATA